MTERMRLTILLARPPVFMLLASYAALGLAQAGNPDGYLPLTEILVVVAGFLVFSVACNDIADEAIDRVNLPGDRRRPLVAAAGGARRRSQVAATGIAGALVALGASAALGRMPLLVVASGFALSAAYSLRPLRVADRGVLAPLLLPACYVAVPFLLGVNAAGRPVTGPDAVLLAGLYLGFIGRIVLKDFRDVRGDALFGKRTFLVRHGRRATCTLSMICWGVGIAVAMAALTFPFRSGSFLVDDVPLAVPSAFALLKIRALSKSADHRRDERLISAIAILGRGTILLLLALLSMNDKGCGLIVSAPVLGVLAILVLLQAITMLRHGPHPRRSGVDRLLEPDPAAGAELSPSGSGSTALRP